MLERARQVTARVALVTATFLAVMGYNFTHNRVFVSLPFVGSVILIVVVLLRPKEVDQADARDIGEKRKKGMAQLLISCTMITGFLVYRALTGDWGMTAGFAIMLASLLPITVLSVIYVRRAPVERRKWRKCDEPSGCEELRHAGRLYGDEELAARGHTLSDGNE